MLSVSCMVKFCGSLQAPSFSGSLSLLFRADKLSRLNHRVHTGVRVQKRHKDLCLILSSKTIAKMDRSQSSLLSTVMFIVRGTIIWREFSVYPSFRSAEVSFAAMLRRVLGGQLTQKVPFRLIEFHAFSLLDVLYAGLNCLCGSIGP